MADFQEDENHQYLTMAAPAAIAEWMLHDVWDAETACQLVVLGYKLPRPAWKALKELDAADALAGALAGGGDLDLELNVRTAAALAPVRGAVYVGLRYPRPPSALEMVDCVAVGRGAAPLAAVLAGAAEA